MTNREHSLLSACIQSPPNAGSLGFRCTCSRKSVKTLLCGQVEAYQANIKQLPGHNATTGPSVMSSTRGDAAKGQQKLGEVGNEENAPSRPFLYHERPAGVRTASIRCFTSFTDRRNGATASECAKKGLKR